MKLLFLLIVTLSFSVFSQSVALTNKDVIDLSKAGIGESIIIAKIKSSIVANIIIAIRAI